MTSSLAGSTCETDPLYRSESHSAESHSAESHRADSTAQSLTAHSGLLQARLTRCTASNSAHTARCSVAPAGPPAAHKHNAEVIRKLFHSPHLGASVSTSQTSARVAVISMSVMKMMLVTCLCRSARVLQ